MLTGLYFLNLKSHVNDFHSECEENIVGAANDFLRLPTVSLSKCFGTDCFERLFLLVIGH